MKKLWVFFGLRLSLVLVLATLLPIMLLYYLGETGLIEAYYQAEFPGPESNSRVVLDLLSQTEIESREATPIDGRLPLDELNNLNAQDPQLGDERLPLEYDPVLDIWRVASESSRVVFSIPNFHFRMELPARLAIIGLPVLSLIIGIVLSVLMSRSVTRPFSSMAAAAQAISDHDLAHRVEARGSKEFQDLAHSINDMAEKLEYAEESRRNLMADVAHELRTPLSVLEGNLRAILDGLHDMNEEEIAILFEQTKHLNHLVNDLRELSLAEADQLSLHFQEVDLNLLIRETVAYFEFTAQEQGVLFSTEIDLPLIHPHLDENRMRQVLHNLISNAIRHTPKGGNIKVTAKQLSDNNAVEISVEDTGVGISKEELPYIFNRFHKTETRENQQREGTGLGLAIAKAIIEMHGGTINVSSEGRGQGAIFSIMLPTN